MRQSSWLSVLELKAIPPSLGPSTLKIHQPVRLPKTRIISSYHSTRSRTLKQMRGKKVGNLSTIFCKQLFFLKVSNTFSLHLGRYKRCFVLSIIRGQINLTSLILEQQLRIKYYGWISRVNTLTRLFAQFFFTFPTMVRLFDYPVHDVYGDIFFTRQCRTTCFDIQLAFFRWLSQFYTMHT